MASIEGIKRRIKEYRPHVQAAFIVWVKPRKSPVDEIDESFDIVHIVAPDDPLLTKIAQPWQMKMVKHSLGRQDLRIIVATKDGEPVGWIWELLVSERRRLAGVPRVQLAPRETFMYDLFVKREYRRSNIGMTMADHFFNLYDPDLEGGPGVDYVYGFISYENAPSILWHYSIGFNIVQTINYLSIGPRIKWKIPFSDVPGFGPMSRRGRHSDPSQELFGTSLLPNL